MTNKLKHSLVYAFALLTLTTSAQIPYDKKLHAGAGFVAGTWGFWAGEICYPKLTDEQCVIFGIASATLAGLGKEIWDEIEYGGFDTKDLKATIIGGVIGTGLSYAGVKIFRRAEPVVVAVNNNLTVGFRIRI